MLARPCGSTWKNVWPALQPVKTLRLRKCSTDLGGQRFGTAVDRWGDVGEDVVGQAEPFGHSGHLCDLVGVLLDHDDIQVDRQPGLVRGGKAPAELDERARPAGYGVIRLGGRAVDAQGQPVGSAVGEQVEDLRVGQPGAVGGDREHHA